MDTTLVAEPWATCAAGRAGLAKCFRLCGKIRRTEALDTSPQIHRGLRPAVDVPEVGRGEEAQLRGGNRPRSGGGLDERLSPGGAGGAGGGGGGWVGGGGA